MYKHSFSKIVFRLSFVFNIVLFSGCLSGVDVYLLSGQVRCNSSKNITTAKHKITILKDELPDGKHDNAIKIGNVSIRYVQTDFRETAIELLKEKAAQCGAQMLYLHPEKSIYNKIDVEASGQTTGAYHPSMYDQVGTMYRYRK
ncbi:MAG: hypothetical protein ABUK01_07065 [Leptospirales bacterium]